MRESILNKAGLSLVSIVIGLAILGVVSSLVFPAFSNQLKRYKHEHFLASSDALVAYAWLRAMQSGKKHRVIYRIKKRVISLEMETVTENKEITYEQVPLYFSANDMTIPAFYEISQFYIDGVDEAAQHVVMDEVWFYVYPRGHTQSVVINMLDTSHESPAEIGLVLNPFMMKYEVHHAFQKP